MVHKNYKWNISKEEGSILLSNTIEGLLRERNDLQIEVDELILLINNP